MISIYKKIINLSRPSVFFYYWKQYSLVKKLHGRLSLASWRLSMEPDVNISASKLSHIKMGKGVCLRSGTEIEALDGAIIAIGDDFFANKNCSIVARFGIIIGTNCMFAKNVQVYDHDHTCTNTFINQQYHGANIKIGNNVWLGANSFICKGVSIGDNVIVGAGTIITKSIPANSIVYNNTDMVIKPLTRLGDAQNINL